jgi:Streptomyces sporulation and cell division protein, SsgA
MRQGKGQNPMMNSVTVSAELGLSLVVPEHGAVPLVASLDYCADDPYAIKMAFHVGTDEPVEWIFARELLAAGLKSGAGEGDVKVWPEDPDGADVLNIALSSPFGEAHFEAPLGATAEFLRSTYGIIPAGCEGEFIDVDTELEELLWQA